MLLELKKGLLQAYRFAFQAVYAELKKLFFFPPAQAMGEGL